MKFKFIILLSSLCMVLQGAFGGAFSSDFVVRESDDAAWNVLPPKIIQLDKDTLPPIRTNDWSVFRSDWSAYRYVYTDVKWADVAQGTNVFIAIENTNTVYYSGEWTNRTIQSSFRAGHRIELFNLNGLKVCPEDRKQEFVNLKQMMSRIKYAESLTNSILAGVFYNQMNRKSPDEKYLDDQLIKQSWFVLENGRLMIDVDRYQLTNQGWIHNHIGTWGFKINKNELEPFCYLRVMNEDMYSDYCVDKYGNGHIYIGLENLECVLTINRNDACQFVQLAKKAH